jgi:hypothetical protein
VRGLVEVPEGALWVPAEITGHPEDYDGWWRVWEEPITIGTEAEKHPDMRREPRQYVIAADVAGGEENTKGDRAFHAVQVIDFLSGKQVAEYTSRIDPDMLATEILLAALWFGQGMPQYAMPIVAVEITGGWGGPVVRRLAHDFNYGKVYHRPKLDGEQVEESGLIGWDTNMATKKQLNATALEMLRLELPDKHGDSGIQSALLAQQLTTYVRLPSGKTEPEDGAFNDAFMAWAIAQQIRMLESPAALDTRPGTHSTSTRSIRSRRIGY